MNRPSLLVTLLVIAVVVILSYVLHEAAHYSMGVLLGHQMTMTLNRAYSVENEISLVDARLIDAAGPIFTIVQAALAFVVLKRWKSFTAFAALLTAAYMRTLAFGVSFSNLNDEARISATLGIGTFTLPVLVAGLLCYLTYRAIHREAISGSTQAISLAAVIVVSSLLIFSDKFL